jgi:hypothetical protein
MKNFSSFSFLSSFAFAQTKDEIAIRTMMDDFMMCIKTRDEANLSRFFRIRFSGPEFIQIVLTKKL